MILICSCISAAHLLRKMFQLFSTSGLTEKSHNFDKIIPQNISAHSPSSDNSGIDKHISTFIISSFSIWTDAKYESESTVHSHFTSAHIFVFLMVCFQITNGLGKNIYKILHFSFLENHLPASPPHTTTAHCYKFLKFICLKQNNSNENKKNRVLAFISPPLPPLPPQPAKQNQLNHLHCKVRHKQYGYDFSDASHLRADNFWFSK